MSDDGPEEVLDSPVGNVKAHIHAYVNSGGEQGHIYRGNPTLLLTTRGRKTGALRRVALIYGRDGDAYLVVASHRGARTHPQWYLNLLADPQAWVQVGAEQFKVRARVAEPVEKPRLWESMLAIHPSFHWYQKRTKRVIPLVILERDV